MNAGLCETCAHVRVLDAASGSRFYRCNRSDLDARFPRYPPLPVARCAGHQPGAPSRAPTSIPRGD